MTRRAFFSLVVVFVALLAGACSNPAPIIGAIVGPSPTTPATPVVPMPNPADGDFQLLTVRGVSPGASGSVHLGQQWSVEYDSYCAAGLIRGVVFENEDHKVLTDRNSENCKGLGLYNYNHLVGSVIDSSVIRFAGGGSLTLRLATAKSVSEWDSHKVQLHGEPIAKWSVE